MSDDLTDRMLDQWAEHQGKRPDAPDDYLANVDHLRRQMDAWQAKDDAYRLLIGVRMADAALRQLTDERGGAMSDADNAHDHEARSIS